MLTVSDLSVAYGAFEVLHDTNLVAPDGEIRAIIGGNGRGKTTLLKAIAGILKPRTGTIVWNGHPIQGKASHRVVREGISFVMQGRLLFHGLTVKENLELGGFILKDSQEVSARMERVLELFPWMTKALGQKAGTLSGGQQQMVAIARALMLDPKLLMLDEPSLGLAPAILDELFDLVIELKKRGVSILLVEQVVDRALSVSDWVYVIDAGTIVQSCHPDTLRDEKKLRAVYFGGGVDDYEMAEA